PPAVHTRSLHDALPIFGGQGERVDEPLFLAGLLPAGAGCEGAAFHGRVLRPPGRSAAPAAGAAEAAPVDGRAAAEGAVVGVAAADVGVVVPIGVAAAVLAVLAGGPGGPAGGRLAVLVGDDPVALQVVVAVAVHTAPVGVGSARGQRRRQNPHPAEYHRAGPQSPSRFSHVG